MNATIKSYNGAREPDFTGAAGRAWRWNGTPPGTVAAWLLHCPGSHPMWCNYLLSVIHLRPIEGQPAHKQTPAATHEMVLFALDPEHEPNPSDARTVRILTPQNLCRQIEHYTALAALRLTEEMAQAFVSGALNPDTDHRVCQERWLDEAIASAARKN